MAKGICEVVPRPWSRGVGEVWRGKFSELKKEALVAEPGGTADVGDGRTSDRREGGSFLSVFQMPVPQEKVDEVVCARLRTGPGAELWVVQAAAPAAPVSSDGVLGWVVVGDMEALANDSFRGRTMVWLVSFNHEARRTGLGVG